MSYGLLNVWNRNEIFWFAEPLTLTINYHGIYLLNDMYWVYICLRESNIECNIEPVAAGGPRSLSLIWSPHPSYQCDCIAATTLPSLTPHTSPPKTPSPVSEKNKKKNSTNKLLSGKKSKQHQKQNQQHPHCLTKYAFNDSELIYCVW